VRVDSFDIRDPEFRRPVLPNAPLVKLGEGFAWLEGPAWFADQDCLLFSDPPNDRILRWSEGGGVSVFRQPSGFANGHTRDRQGRLLGRNRLPFHVSNLEFGGRNLSRLFFCAANKLFATYTKHARDEPAAATGAWHPAATEDGRLG